jgi:hypothetical protein
MRRGDAVKLIIRRSQNEDRGFLGNDKGMTFKLEAWAELTEDEAALMNRYKGAAATILAVVRDLNPKQPTVVVTPGTLIAGQVFQCKDVLTLVGAEAEIKGGCEQFRVLLDVMASFGGVEHFEFTSAVGALQGSAVAEPVAS